MRHIPTGELPGLEAVGDEVVLLDQLQKVLDRVALHVVGAVLPGEGLGFGGGSEGGGRRQGGEEDGAFHGMGEGAGESGTA